MRTSSRAQRRHDDARLKHNRSRHQLVRSALESPHGTTERDRSRVLGKHLACAAMCSCAMCGNPRKFFGELTRQELRQRAQAEATEAPGPGGRSACAGHSGLDAEAANAGGLA